MAGVQNAHSLFEQEASRRKITTFCKEMDDALGGGVATGRIAEFSGMPAVGKTQLGMQLALNVQIPRCYGGVDGRALYIDAEGGVTAERVTQLAEALLLHLQRQARTRGGTRRVEAVKAMSAETMVRNITVLRVTSSMEACGAVELLDQYLLEDGLQKETPPIKLIVFDTVSCQLSHGFGNHGKRTRGLAYLSERLMELTVKHPAVAVVLMNNLTTKFTALQEPYLAPALGEAWTQTATERVELRWQGTQRVAHVTKCAHAESSKLHYLVTRDGFRGSPATKRKEAPTTLLQDNVHQLSNKR